MKSDRLMDRYLVGHHVEQRAGLSEVIDGFLQVSEGLPLLQGLRKLPDPENSDRDPERDGVIKLHSSLCNLCLKFNVLSLVTKTLTTQHKNIKNIFI